MFRPAVRASGGSICRLEPNSSAGPNAAAVKARPPHGSRSTHQCGTTTAITILFNRTEFCSTHCSPRAKASDPSPQAPPDQKATFQAATELSHLSPSTREQPGLVPFDSKHYSNYLYRLPQYTETFTNPSPSSINCWQQT